jgi:hypothetical protein
MKPLNAHYTKEVIEELMQLYLEAEAIENGELWKCFPELQDDEDVLDDHVRNWNRFADNYPEFKMKPYEAL